MTPGIFLDNRNQSRFELREQGQTVTADYRRHEGLLVITYVFAPPALRGTGAAGRLMEQVAATARAEGVRIIPTCGYARAWLRSRKAHRDLLAGPS